MLRTDKDYQETVARLEAEKERLLQYEKELREMDLSDEQVQQAMAPQWSFHAQLVLPDSRSAWGGTPELSRL